MVRRSPPFLHDFQELPNGDLVWNASLVLLNHFQDLGTEYWKGKKVLELGSGSGDLGFGLSLLGADVTCTEMPGKMMNVLDSGIANLEAEAERTCGGSVSCKPLLWGEEGWKNNPLEGTFDVVISAELVYLEETHMLLIWTWAKVCTPDTIIYSIFVNRPFSWNFFVHLDDTKGFEVTQIENFDALGMDDIHFHTIRKKADPVKLLIGENASPGENVEGEKEQLDAEASPAFSSHEKEEKESDTEETAACTVEENTVVAQTTTEEKIIEEEMLATPATTTDTDTALVEETNEGKDSALAVETSSEGKPNEEKEVSLIDLIDELLGVSLEKLQLWVNICLGILLFISAILIYNEYKKKETLMMFLHIGFSLLVICLGGSVSYVINEAQDIERKKKIN